MTSRARTLQDALDVLDVRPLEFSSERPAGSGDPAFYAEPPPRDHDGPRSPGPMESIRDQLLTQARPTKVFLSGHVGSGKSTEINRLATDPDIQNAFTVVLLRLEAQLAPFLDTAQLLFLMAGAVFERARAAQLLGEGGRWRELLLDLNAELFGEKGLQTKEGGVSAEIDLVFIKIREELKLSERRRRQFRDFGETQRTLLQDLLKELTLDIEMHLAEQGRHDSILVLIDDLDKVRGPEEQRDIFDINLASLLAPPFRILYTVPTGVAFGPKRTDVRQSLEHLYPVRVIDKSPDGRNPERAYITGSDEFSAGLLSPDYEALTEIHRTHGLRSDADRRYLDESRVLECYNDKVWYEVHPLLWSLLER